MTRLKVTIVGFVTLTDDMERRLEEYGTTDPAACARIDQDNAAQSRDGLNILFEDMRNVEYVRVTPVEER